MRSLLLAAVVAFGCGSASAQSSVAGAKDTDPDPVLVFNRICYAQVPDVEAIQTMALKLAWRSMDKEQVKEFDVYDQATTVLGWEAQVGERLFQVGLVQAPPPEKMLKTFPDFKGGTVTTCSLIMDDQQNAADFMPNMQKLAGKEPASRDVPEGLLNTTTWAGGNDNLKVFLFAKAPATGKGGLLNVTVLQK